MPSGRKGRSELADLWLTPCRLQGTASRSDSAICAEYAMLMSGWCSLCVAEVQVAGASARGGCDACGWCCSGGVEPDFDADGVGGGGGCAGDAGGPAGGLVVGEDVAALEHPGDLVLGPAAPGLGQHDDRDDRADARAGQFVVQGEEVGVAPFGGQQRAGVVDDGGHYPAARWGSSSISPASMRN